MKAEYKVVWTTVVEVELNDKEEAEPWYDMGLPYLLKARILTAAIDDLKHGENSIVEMMRIF